MQQSERALNCRDALMSIVISYRGDRRPAYRPLWEARPYIAEQGLSIGPRDPDLHWLRIRSGRKVTMPGNNVKMSTQIRSAITNGQMPRKICCSGMSGRTPATT